LQLLVLAILARLLTPKDFGVVGIAMIFVGFAALFSQLGVGPALIQRTNLTSVHIRVGFTLAVLSSIILVLLMWTISPLIAAFFRNDQVVDVLDVVSINFFLSGFGVVSESLLKRDLKFQKLMWVDIISYAVGYAGIGITAALRGYGVWALVMATLGQTLVKSILLYLSQRHPLKPALAGHELRELLHFGSGFTLARILNYGAKRGDYFVIGRVLNAEILGIYTRAYQLMMLPAKYFGEVLNKVLFPIMAKAQSEKSRLKKMYLVSVATSALVSAPASVLMVILAPEIVKVLLGSKWLEAILPFQILSIGILSRISYKIDDSLARALGVMYKRSLRDGIYMILVVCGCWIGLHWGLGGAAIGVLSAVVINHILAIRMSMKLLDCHLPEIMSTQIPSLKLAAVVLVLALVMRNLLVAHNFSPLIILLLTTIICGLALSGIFYWRPNIIGSYGTYALTTIFQSVPARILPSRISERLASFVKGV